MSHVNSNDAFVMLCDWRGRCTWANVVDRPLKVGEFIWEHLKTESQAKAKDVLSRVVALRERQPLEVENQQGERFRVWLWPLDSPDVAVCVLGTLVPNELAMLTARERACLELLGQGIETRSIAEQLDVSISTVHTHMKRAREKLGLPNVETLISFAARYCYPPTKSLSSDERTVS